MAGAGRRRALPAELTIAACWCAIGLSRRRVAAAPLVRVFKGGTLGSEPSGVWQFTRCPHSISPHRRRDGQATLGASGQPPVVPGFRPPRTGPLGVHVVGASVAVVTAQTPAECGALCVAHGPQCVSFNFFPDGSQEVLEGGQPPKCELNAYSAHYAVAEGRNATYYLREVPRDDSPSVQAVPWRVNPPAGNVTLTGGALHQSAATGIAYVLSQYSVDDVLYWFRVRAGVKSPPGHNHGWDGGKGAPDYPYGLEGSIAGLYLMGVGGALRWQPDNTTLRANLNAVVDGIAACADSDGFIMAYNKTTTGRTEHPDYVLSWVTYGLLAAHAAGNAKALPLLRGQLTWFNYCDELPEFLPPDGGPGTQGYNGWALPAKWEPSSGHDIYLIYQGMIHNTQMALTELGTSRDVAVVRDLYEETWWLTSLIAGDPDAIWRRHWYPHNYEVTAFEAYLDLYVLTGNSTYLAAVEGAWQLFRDHWIHPGGSMAINEGVAIAGPTYPNNPNDISWNTSVRYPPSSYYLCAGADKPPVNTTNGPQEQPGTCNLNTGELCGSMFWTKLNQRLHRLDPNNETFAWEIERSVYNVGMAAQVPDGSRIRYFARLHGYKQPGYNIGTCCEGQGTRMFGQLPGFVFSTADDGTGDLWVNMFAASRISWSVPSRGNSSGSGKHGAETATLVMTTEFPFGSAVTITFTSVPTGAAPFALHVRSPQWLATPSLHVSVNGKPVAAIARGTYGALSRSWKTGDVVVFELSAAVTPKVYQGASVVRGYERYSFTYGPLLLAAVAGNGVGDGGWQRMPDVGWDSTPLNLVLSGVAGPPDRWPASWLAPVAGKPSHFAVRGSNVTLVPYLLVQDEHFTAFPLVTRG